MPELKQETLYGWGHFPGARCLSYRPEKRRDLDALLSRHGEALLARGLGRSYGDAALQPAGTVKTERLDHIISFEAGEGVLQAQAGVTLADVMALCIPCGWLPPVIPGTKHVSLGGAFACNVHGKNHWRFGDFAEHVLSIRLRLASGEIVECTKQDNRDLFWATAGGMGMTGIIEEVTLKLRPVASASLKTTAYRVDSIADMIAAFEHYRSNSDYMVGWVDHMADGGAGRGIFEAASHSAPEEGGAPLKKFLSPEIKFFLPCFLPSFTLNRVTMSLYNKWRFRRYSEERREDIVGFEDFFHPLDAIGNWNRLYGRRGFFQYQCLLPDAPDIVEQVRTLLSAIHKRKCFSFLAVIKYHREGKGYLTFSKEGYSIALDFPNTRRARALLPQIDRWVADRGGRVYLAKDALLSPDLFYRMYGQSAQDWMQVLRKADPAGRFTSLMSDRLQWKQLP
ncbi:MAG: FAD-binding oxidoreductase [Pseudomonadota bacterium]|nr:FAD-binding oxidoreductase [Pseudomonadota bacterium]MDE3037613.1 FAD-binding oxidoreductase [Pseudomonadota bacterium]